MAEVVRAGLHFGEGPRWHDGRLWYSDFYDHGVHALDEEGRDERVLEVEGQPSGLGWLPDGRLLVVSMTDRRLLRLEEDGTLVEHADLSAFEPFRSNDMVVDRAGRAYVGGFGFDLDAWMSAGGGGGAGGPVATVVSRVDPDGTAQVAAREMMFPNGSVVIGHDVLVVAETFGARLTAFDIAPDGSLANRRVWADLSGTGVVPDGICLDRDGRIWVANALASHCALVAEGGAVLERVEFSQNCYACALGGADGRTLYAMTAPSSAPAAVSGIGQGRVEAATVSVPAA